tara:strand:- start:440 stop:982 length:543 start_codon:yes stop_codon:yes gene_type:complete
MLNISMRKNIFSFLAIFFICFSLTAKAGEGYPDPSHDYNNDDYYQSLASDFREYTVCGAIHDNLMMLVAVNIGVGSNLGYPTEYVQRMQELIDNIKSQRTSFDEKSELVIKKLIKDYNFPLPGLLEQAKANRFQTQQSIWLALAQGKEQPGLLANVVKSLLAQSQTCRDYSSLVDYSDVE